MKKEIRHIINHNTFIMNTTRFATSIRDTGRRDAVSVISDKMNSPDKPHINWGFILVRLLILLGIVILFNISGKAQDQEFSQFYANPLYLNPALAGAENYNRAVVNYRNQWPGMGKGFVTYNASYDQGIDKLHGGIGVLLNVDNAGNGLLTTTQASLIYAYTLNISDVTFINMAMQGTFYQRSLNWDMLRFGDQIDLLQKYDLPTGETRPVSTSIMTPDFSAGVAFGWKSAIYGGLAVNHLTEPNLSFSGQNNNLPMKITGHFGANLNLQGGSMLFDPVFYLSTNILYQQQGNFHQVNLGLYFVRIPIVLGAWFRHNFENPDAIIALAGITYKSIKIGYSYDITMSQIKSYTGGAHEISVAWQFNYKERLRRIYRLNAPGF